MATDVACRSNRLGLPITYRIVSGPASVSGNVLTITGTGVVDIAAEQSGSSSSYLPAPTVILQIAVVLPPESASDEAPCGLGGLSGLLLALLCMAMHLHGRRLRPRA